MSLMEKIGLWEKTSSVTNGNSALAFLSFERSVPQLQFSGYWCMDAGRENLLKGSQSTRICCLAPIIPASHEFYPEVTKPPLVGTGLQLIYLSVVKGQKMVFLGQ